jgi:MSHA biogenesis protein MshJ
MTAAKHWQDWRGRFARLSPRERGLVFAAVLVALVMGSESLFITPLWQQRRVLNKDIQARQGELATLQQVVAILEAPGNTAGAGELAQLQALERQLAEQDGQLDRFRAGLVAPREMPSVLEALLARHHRLKLVALKTLAAEAVGASVESPGAEPPAAAPAQAAASPADGTQHLYRHPVELTVRGSYADLAAYVSALERLRPRLLWRALELDAGRPTGPELRLRLYTLSLDKAWLAL